MNYYGNDEERVRLIAGLRDLARAVAIPHSARDNEGVE